MVIKGSSATQMQAPNSSRGPARPHMNSLPPTRSPLPVNSPSHLVPNPSMYFQQGGMQGGMHGKSIISQGSRHNLGLARAGTTGNIVPVAPPRVVPGAPTAPVAAAPKRRQSWVKGVAKSVPPPSNRRHVIPASGLNITSSLSMTNSNNAGVPSSMTNSLGTLTTNQKPVSLAQHASRKVVPSQKIPSALGDDDVSGNLGGGANALASALAQPYVPFKNHRYQTISSTKPYLRQVFASSSKSFLRRLSNCVVVIFV